MRANIFNFQVIKITSAQASLNHSVIVWTSLMTGLDGSQCLDLKIKKKPVTWFIGFAVLNW